MKGNEMKAEKFSVKQVAVTSLKEYAGNPRDNDGAVDAVAESISRFGFRVPIIVDKDGVIIAGHTRLKAALKLGLEKVPVHTAADLTPRQARELRIADNKVSELAEWDMEALADELAAIYDDGGDMDGVGFTASELADLIGDDCGGQTDEDAIPEPPAKPISKLGKVYRLGNHRLMCGDSTSDGDVARLMDGVKADMVFTDPPYGVNYEGGHFHSGNVNLKRKREKLSADENTDIYKEFLPVIQSFVDGPCYMWFAGSKARDVYNAVFDNNFEIHALIIWHKTNATYAAMNAQYKQRHEPCLYFKPKGSTLRWCGSSTEATVWSEDRDGINEFHPTQKPTALSYKAINNHEAKTVLDLFAGSGSTIISSEKLRRKCYGMEISNQYCDVIRKRWAEFVHGEGCNWKKLTPEVK